MDIDLHRNECVVLKSNVCICMRCWTVREQRQLSWVGVKWKMCDMLWLWYYATHILHIENIAFYTACNFSIYRTINMFCLGYSKCVYLVVVLCVCEHFFFHFFIDKQTPSRCISIFPEYVFLHSLCSFLLLFGLDLDIGFILTWNSWLSSEFIWETAITYGKISVTT